VIFVNLQVVVLSLVDIQSGTTGSKDLTAFGYEPFTAFNVLNTDIYQLSDNVTIYKGNHEINLGTSNEIDKFKMDLPLTITVLMFSQV